jgi:peroxiredoxin Q/BCP
MGVERTTFLIRDGKIARTWRKVSVPGHAEEVLEAAKSF